MSTARILRAQVLAAPLLLAGCTDSPPRTIIDPYLEATGADYIAFGFRYTGLGPEGVLEFTVEGDTALTFSDSMLFHGNVKFTAYHEGLGTVKAVVTSERATLDMDTNEMLAEGNAVMIIQADGRRIESYELRYAPEQDAIRSDSATVMYDGDSVVEGTGFNSDMNFERVRVRNALTRGGAVRF